MVLLQLLTSLPISGLRYDFKENRMTLLDENAGWNEVCLNSERIFTVSFLVHIGKRKSSKQNCNGLYLSKQEKKTKFAIHKRTNWIINKKMISFKKKMPFTMKLNNSSSTSFWRLITSLKTKTTTVLFWSFESTSSQTERHSNLFWSIGGTISRNSISINMICNSYDNENNKREFLKNMKK